MSDSPHQPPRIILLGPRGGGKSEVGRLLAQRLGVKFVDLDVLVQRAALKPISQIFEDLGEAGFRELESDALRDALAGDAGVIATGGGVILRAPNRDRLLHTDALRIFLTAEPAILWHRINADPNTPLTRPAFTRRGGEAEIRHVLDQRMTFYRQVCTHDIDTSAHSPAEVVDHILDLMRPGHVPHHETSAG